MSPECGSKYQVHTPLNARNTFNDRYEYINSGHVLHVYNISPSLGFVLVETNGNYFYVSKQCCTKVTLPPGVVTYIPNPQATSSAAATEVSTTYNSVVRDCINVDTIADAFESLSRSSARAEPKCECGVESVMGAIPASGHSSWCPVFKEKDEPK